MNIFLQIIAFDELKTDYKNPIDQCSSLNPVRFVIFYALLHIHYPFSILNHSFIYSIQLVLPEYAIHIFFNLLFMFSGEWVTLVFNIPLIAYHIHRYVLQMLPRFGFLKILASIHRYMNRPVMSGPGLYDPTNIMNADVLSKCQREGWVKLAFYLISFFFYLYG